MSALHWHLCCRPAEAGQTVTSVASYLLRLRDDGDLVGRLARLNVRLVDASPLHVAILLHDDPGERVASRTGIALRTLSASVTLAAVAARVTLRTLRASNRA